VGPISAALRGDVPAEEAALSVGVGFAGGMFPFIGATTPVCVLLMSVFSLFRVSTNVPIVMALNFALAVPSVLAIPFFVKMGERLSPSEGDAVPFDVSGLQDTLSKGLGLTFRVYGHMLMWGFIAWSIFAVIVILVARTVLIVPFTKLSSRKRIDAADTGVADHIKQHPVLRARGNTP